MSRVRSDEPELYSGKECLLLSDKEIREAAASHVTDAELRMLIEAELGEYEPDLPSVRLKLAADMLCDAAMEVAAIRFDAPRINKLLVQGDVQISYSDLAIVEDVDRNVESGNITQEELNALLLRSSIAHVVSQAVAAGASEEDIASGEVKTTSLRLTEMQKTKRKSLLSRLFGSE